MFSICVRDSLWSPCLTARHFLERSSRNTKDSHELWSRNTKDSLELCVELCSRSSIWRKIPWQVPPQLSLSDAQVFHMHRWVFVKPMFYGSTFSWRKIEKNNRFAWIMHWIMLLEWHLMENSMVNSSATQFILCTCFLYVYVSPCEANVLRLNIFMEEDQ